MNNNDNNTEAVSKFQDLSIAPMHTAEHILNQTMVRMFSCERSKNAHIERKKSKINYILSEEPSQLMIEEIERRVNSVIEADMPVYYEKVMRDDIPDNIPLDRLPESVGEELRLVHIGNYDTCACIGVHVERTSQLGVFKINSTSYKDGQFRIVFKLIQ